MKFDDIKKLPPEWQPIITELASIPGRLERIEEKMEAVLKNQIALNYAIKGLEAEFEKELSDEHTGTDRKLAEDTH